MRLSAANAAAAAVHFVTFHAVLARHDQQGSPTTGHVAPLWSITWTRVRVERPRRRDCRHDPPIVTDHLGTTIGARLRRQRLGRVGRQFHLTARRHSNEEVHPPSDSPHARNRSPEVCVCVCSAKASICVSTSTRRGSDAHVAPGCSARGMRAVGARGEHVQPASPL